MRSTPNYYQNLLQLFLILLLMASHCLINMQVEAFSISKATAKLHNSQLPFHPVSYSTRSFSTSSPTRLQNQNIPSLSSPSSSSPSPKRSSTRATAVYALILINLLVFIMDKVLHNPWIPRNLYFFHRNWKWWQPLTACFCHMDRFHLSNNLFLLLLFGRSVEDDQGWPGLLFSYVWCGVLASLVSLWVMPKNTISIGASGAVFGLFAVSTLAKLSLREIFDWRNIVEVAVLGEFVFRQIASELAVVAGGGNQGINHAAHLSGAFAGALLVFLLRTTLAKLEPDHNKPKKNM